MLNDPRCRLFICGRGELESRLKQQVKALQLEDQVQFLGYRKDIPQLCCAADIFVFTSIQEGLPRALMEAMANGKAVVCSDIRGNVDLIENGKGGFVVTNEAEPVAQAIARLAEDPQLRTEMGAYNVRTVDAFREERALEAAFALLNSL